MRANPTQELVDIFTHEYNTLHSALRANISLQTNVQTLRELPCRLIAADWPYRMRYLNGMCAQPAAVGKPPSGDLPERYHCNHAARNGFCLQLVRSISVSSAYHQQAG